MPKKQSTATAIKSLAFPRMRLIDDISSIFQPFSGSAFTLKFLPPHPFGPLRPFHYHPRFPHALVRGSPSPPWRQSSTTPRLKVATLRQRITRRLKLLQKFATLRQNLIKLRTIGQWIFILLSNTHFNLVLMVTIAHCAPPPLPHQL